MGSVYIVEEGKGTDVATVFRRLREQAQYECGHGGYTGTLAEAPGAFVFDQGIRTLAQARAFADDQSGSPLLQKWEPVGAVSYRAGRAGPRRRITVRVPGRREGSNRFVRLDDVMPPVIAGCHPVSVSACSDVEPRVAAKIKTTRNPDHASVYRVVGPGTGHAGRDFATLAQAKEAARALVGRALTSDGESKATITKVTVAAGGAPPWVITSSQTSRLECEVAYEYDAVASDPVEGWIYFGWVSS